MDIVIGFLMVLETLVCLLLILIVLMQRPRQEGLGAAFGSGMTDQMFGAQTTNVLQKGTTWLGITFFALTFFLAITVAHQDKRKGSLPKLVDEADKKALPAATTPANMPKNITETLEALIADKAKKPAENAATPEAPASTPAPESKSPTLTPPAPVPGSAPTPPPAPVVPATTPAAAATPAPAPKTGN